MKIKMLSGSTKDCSKTFPCTYHGWVMIPLDLGQGRKLPYNDVGKMLKIGKKIATSQIAARRDGDKAVVILNPTGLMVRAETPRPGPEAAAPLLSAAMETISCVLLSKDTGIAVIMAFTFDHKGERGVGCDVIRFGSKPKKAIKQFGLHFNKSMALQEKSRAFLAARAARASASPGQPVAPQPALNAWAVETAAPVAQPQAPSNGAEVEIDQVLAAEAVTEAEDRFGPTPAPFADCDTDGGYMTTVAVTAVQRRRSSAFNEQPNGQYLDVDPSGTSGGYLDCIQDDAAPAGDGDDHQYIMVRARRSCSRSSSTGVGRSGCTSVDCTSG